MVTLDRFDNILPPIFCSLGLRELNARAEWQWGLAPNHSEDPSFAADHVRMPVRQPGERDHSDSDLFWIPCRQFLVSGESRWRANPDQTRTFARFRRHGVADDTTEGEGSAIGSKSGAGVTKETPRRAAD
jgi:hypothetical protein